MENSKEIKTTQDLFDLLKETINADCRIGTYQYETYYIIYIETAESTHQYKVEHFKNDKGVELYLCECLYHTEKELVLFLFNEIINEMKQKIENLYEIQNKLKRIPIK